MSTKRVILVCVACALLGVGVGYFGTDRIPGKLSSSEMRERLEQALREPDVLARHAELARSLQALDAENSSGMLEALEPMVPVIGETELTMIVSRWARLGPAQAVERVLEWPRRETRRVALGEVVYVWALEDPASAMQVVESLPSEDRALREHALERLVLGWGQSADLPGVTAYLAGLPPVKERQTLTSQLAAEQLRIGGPAALMRWVDSIADTAGGHYKLVAFRKAVRMLAQVDPEAAVEWLGRHEGREYTEGAARLIATMWVQEDPPAALEWLLARPEARDDPMVLHITFRTWANTDVSGLGAWLEPRADDPLLDPAIEEYARGLAPADAAKAVTWAQRIRDPERRIASLTDIGRQWVAQDADSAKAWLADSGLPEDVQRSIMTPRRKARGQLGAVAPGVATEGG